MVPWSNGNCLAEVNAVANATNAALALELAKLRANLTSSTLVLFDIYKAFINTASAASESPPSHLTQQCCHCLLRVQYSQCMYCTIVLINIYKAFINTASEPSPRSSHLVLFDTCTVLSHGPTYAPCATVVTGGY